MSAGEGSALVTGASRGIGRAIALRLARDGYEVIGVARGRGALDALRDEIVAAGGGFRPIAVDLSNAQDTAQAVSGLDVDVLVNNSGTGIIKAFVDLSLDEWRAMVDLDVKPPFSLHRAR